MDKKPLNNKGRARFRHNLKQLFHNIPLIFPKGFFDLKPRFLSKTAFNVTAFALFNLLLLAPRYADAFIHNSIQNAIIWFLNNLLPVVIAVIIGIATLVINVVLAILAFIAKMIMEAMFSFTMNMPYVDMDGGNPAFEAGWSILRDVANMGLIIVLIAIAVGTMLSLKNVNKSLLGKFIIVALLINFTPVFTGIIIDMSHIVASIFWNEARLALNAYLDASIWQQALAGLRVVFDFIVPGADAEDGLFSSDFSFLSLIGFTITSIVTIVLNLMLIFVFLFLAAIALFRTAMLVVLVILSPIAFASYILPATNKAVATKWFQNFIQWTIIIIPLSFFLWIGGLFAIADPMCDQGQPLYDSIDGAVDIEGGNETNEILQQATGAIDEDGESDEEFGGVLSNEFMCPAILTTLALGSLVIGTILSFSFTAMGANIVINRAKKIQRSATNYAKRKSVAAAKRTRDSQVAKTREGTRTRLRDIPGVRNVGGRQLSDAGDRARERIGQTGSNLQKRGVVGAPLRGLDKKAQQAVARDKKRVDEEYNNLKKQGGTYDIAKTQIYSKNQSKRKAAQRLAAELDEKRFREAVQGERELRRSIAGDASEAIKRHGGGKEGARRAINEDRTLATVLRKTPEALQEAFNDSEIQMTQEELREGMNTLVQKMDPKEIASANAEFFRSGEVIRALRESGKENNKLLQDIARNGGSEAVQNYDIGTRHYIEQSFPGVKMFKRDPASGDITDLDNSNWDQAEQRLNSMKKKHGLRLNRHLRTTPGFNAAMNTTGQHDPLQDLTQQIQQLQQNQGQQGQDGGGGNQGQQGQDGGGGNQGQQGQDGA